MTSQIITIVGKSNSGKTTLLEQLVAELTRRGFRIGTAKHTHCGFDVDRKGKDSWRHRQAGASATLMVTDGQAILVKDDERTSEQKLTAYLDGMDLVLAEGFKSLGFPKIEIFRTNAGHAAPLFMDSELDVGQTLEAFVTDSDHRPDAPVYGLDDITGISDFIEKNFLR